MKLEHAPVPALRPSEYTAALIQVLQANKEFITGARVLDVGSGSGIVLAAMAEMGAACIASAGAGVRTGKTDRIHVKGREQPVVVDLQRVDGEGEADGRELQREEARGAELLRRHVERAEHRYRPLTEQGWVLRFEGDDLGAVDTGRAQAPWPTV